jgi:hypothetical protein
LAADEDKLEGERKRGHDAEALLENPLWVEARSAIRKKFMEEWKNSPPRDTEGRERIYLMIRIADLYEDYIRSFAETGRLASKQLSDLGERKKILGII